MEFSTKMSKHIPINHFDSKREAIKRIVHGISASNFKEEDIDLWTDEILAFFADDPPEPERWKPKEGEEFCFITHAGYVYCENYSDKTNEDFWEFGNCFKTREETEQARDKVKETLLAFHKAHRSVV